MRGKIAYAPGVSVVINWCPSDGLPALDKTVDLLLKQKYPSRYINTTILHRNEAIGHKTLQGLLKIAAKVNAAIVFYEEQGDLCPKERALRVAPSKPVFVLGSSDSIEDDTIYRGLQRLCKGGDSVSVDDHFVINQSFFSPENPSPCCAVIPTSIPALTPRVEIAARSVMCQEMGNSTPDVLVAYSFNSLRDDSVLIAKMCMRKQIPLLLHRHRHKIFPPALARNVGARRVVDRPVAFIDADIYLHPDTFRESILLLEGGPCVVYVEPAMMQYVDERSPIFQGMTKKEFEERSNRAGSAPGTGSVVFVTQDALAATHGYDERFIGYGFTDWDFTERLPAAGFRVVSLTKRTGIKGMHIPHGARHGTNPPSEMNRKIYSEEKGRNPKRNPTIWGGIPVDEYEVPSCATKMLKKA